MLFEKFLNLIDRTPIGAIVDKRLDIIEKTDPDRIYVENIRAYYNLPFAAAKTLCELAVKERIFKKKIGVICPNDECGRIIKSYDSEKQMDEKVTCIQCELRECEEHSFIAKDLEKIVFYQLQD
jgi:hypothetical protein